MIVIQNTIEKTLSTDMEQLKRFVGGVLMDEFALLGTIQFVYVIEDCIKSGRIASSLHGSNLDVRHNVYQLEIVHSAYT